MSGIKRSLEERAFRSERVLLWGVLYGIYRLNRRRHIGIPDPRYAELYLMICNAVDNWPGVAQEQKKVYKFSALFFLSKFCKDTQYCALIDHLMRDIEDARVWRRWDRR